MGLPISDLELGPFTNAVPFLQQVESEINKFGIIWDDSIWIYQLLAQRSGTAEDGWQRYAHASAPGGDRIGIDEFESERYA